MRELIESQTVRCIAWQAKGPGNPEHMGDPTILDIAERHGKNVG